MIRRVVITGIGALTPIGNNTKDYWGSLKNGVSGAAPITYFNTEIKHTKFACELKNFQPTDFLDRKESRKLDRFSQYAMIVAKEASNTIMAYWLNLSSFLDSFLSKKSVG
jgi:3-oxoacyl-[acyl-carrier-protein] synthase II